MDKYSVTWKINMRINFNQQPCVCARVCVCERERKRLESKKGREKKKDVLKIVKSQISLH